MSPIRANRSIRKPSTRPTRPRQPAPKARGRRKPLEANAASSKPATAPVTGQRRHRRQVRDQRFHTGHPSTWRQKHVPSGRRQGRRESGQRQHPRCQHQRCVLKRGREHVQRCAGVPEHVERLGRTSRGGATTTGRPVRCHRIGRGRRRGGRRRHDRDPAGRRGQRRPSIRRSRSPHRSAARTGQAS